MRRSPRQLLRRAGVDVARYPLHTTLEGHLRWLLEAEGVTTVLDVGANQGQFGQKLRTVSRFTGRIISFEPFPESLRVLQKAAANDPNWASLPFALGNFDEQLDLLAFDGSDWNSLHAPDRGNLAKAKRSLESVGSVLVDVRRLDGCWDDIVLPNEIVFLKSDTQGHDLRVLEGAGSRLQSVVGVLLEASILPFYEGEPGLAESLSALAEYGFEPTGFFPVARRRDSLALTTVDVCFVRIDR